MKPNLTLSFCCFFDPPIVSKLPGKRGSDFIGHSLFRGPSFNGEP